MKQMLTMPQKQMRIKFILRNLRFTYMVNVLRVILVLRILASNDW